MIGPPRLERVGLILTAAGIASASAIRYAPDTGSGVAFATGMLLSLALVAVSATRRAFRSAHLAAFGAFALASVGLGLPGDRIGAPIIAYLAVAGLVTLATPAVYRPLAVGGFALWTPVVRIAGPQQSVDPSFPLALTVAAVLSLLCLVVLLLARDGATPVERVWRIGLGILSVACVAAVVDRHASVASPGTLAPDDLLALAAVGIFPLLAILRLRPAVRDACGTGLALAIYALAGVALIIGQGYQVDTVVAQHRATELFLQGENPYRSLDVVAALRERGLDPALGTHLEDGTQVHSLSYPALSFLVPAPFMALGVTDVRLVYLGEIVLLILVLLRPIRPHWRSLAAAVVVGSAIITRQTIGAGVDPTYALLLVLAVTLIRHRTASPILIGLAAASRQPAWFFIPFYLAETWRRDGRREALRRGAIVAAAAIVPNLPFFFDAPGAFLSGVSGPMLQALEPYGVGLVRFGLEGVLPLWPRFVYGLLSAVALAGLLALLWRRARPLPNGFMVFPSLVLWFSWRSAQNYFSFAGVFALAADEELRADGEIPAVASHSSSAVSGGTAPDSD